MTTWCTPLEGGREFLCHFSSPNSYYETAQFAPRNGFHSEVSREFRPDGWAGTDTFEEAVEFAKHGWPAGLAAFKAVQAQIKLRPKPGIGRVWEDAQVGAFPIVPIFLSGSPEHMRAPSYKTVNYVKQVTLLVQSGAMANFQPNDILTYGLAICALIDTLENSGVRVAVWTARNTELKEGILSVFVNLKKLEEAFDPNKIVFPIANVAFHRRFGFSIYERFPTNPKPLRVLHLEYGRSGRINPKTSLSLKHMWKINAIPEDAIILPEIKPGEEIPEVLSRFKSALPESFAFVWEDN